MTTQTTDVNVPSAAAQGRWRPADGRALRALIRVEVRLSLREPAGMVWGLGLPVVLLIVFGSIPAFTQPSRDLGGLTPLDVYLPILFAMVLAMLGLIALPGPLAYYREQGVLRRMAATPVSPALVLAAQLAVNLAIALTSLALMLVIGAAAYGLHLPRQGFGFVLALLLAAAGLFSMGLWVAAVARTGKAAQAIGALLFFPLEFMAGLWIPRPLMPAALRDISDFTPLGAAVAALQNSMGGTFPSAQSLLVLAGYAGAFGYAAVRMFSWE
jgi:ABC-2 type transport system permease protein